MTCHNADFCANYPNACKECWTMADIYKYYPHYVEKENRDVKFKIFFGTLSENTADLKLNKWLSENPDVAIIDFRYSHARMGDHSICIMYEEKR